MKNPIRVENGFAYVTLFDRKKNPVAEVIIDPADVELIAPYRWTRQDTGSGIYAKTSSWGGKLNRTVYMHRVINNTPERLLCDHINGNRLDNRRSNLRAVTTHVNTMHRRTLNSTNRSGMHGVSWESYTGKWRVVLTIAKGVKVRLGRYASLDEAKRVAMENSCGELGPKLAKWDPENV